LDTASSTLQPEKSRGWIASCGFGVTDDLDKSETKPGSSRIRQLRSCCRKTAAIENGLAKNSGRGATASWDRPPRPDRAGSSSTMDRQAVRDPPDRTSSSKGNETGIEGRITV